MLFLSNIEGVIVAVAPSPLHQNSQNANEIVLIAPFPAGAVVSVAFQLPNGQYVRPYLAEGDDRAHLMKLLPAFSSALYDGARHQYNAWCMVMDYPLTQQSGSLTLQFTATMEVDGKSVHLPTGSVSFEVEKGVPYLPPETPSADAWSEMRGAISAANTNVLNLDTSLKALSNYIGMPDSYTNTLTVEVGNLTAEVGNLTMLLNDLGADVRVVEGDISTINDGLSAIQREIEEIFSKAGFFRWESADTVSTYEFLSSEIVVPKKNGEYMYDGHLYRVEESGTYLDIDGVTERNFPANALFAFDVITERWYPIGGDDTPVDTSTLVTRDEFNDTIGDIASILSQLNNGGTV